MMLRKQMRVSGEWLFRWRSFVPVVLAVPVLTGMYCCSRPPGSPWIEESWELICIAISLMGLGIRAITVAFVPAQTSGRNTRYQLAAELNTTGMYSIVRNPLYLGNYVTYLGVSLFPRVWWAPVLMSLALFLYYERIVLVEEEFLLDRFGSRFTAWAAKTPAFLPRVDRWRRPELKPSFRTILRREYSGLMGIATAFFVLEFLENVFVWRRVVLDRDITVFFLIVCGLYMLLRTMKRKTSLLDVSGR